VSNKARVKNGIEVQCVTWDDLGVTQGGR